MSEKRKIIIDGDWGGDEMQLTSVLAANPDRFEILGATTTFGNTHHDQVVENGRNILHFLKASHIPCYPGARCPSGATEQPVGDGAHGSDGIGNVGLEASPSEHQTKQSVDFILETLRDNEPGTITITASGPLTNIAQALRKDPAAMRRVKEIVIMGGCTTDMPAADTPIRRGNITHHAEFNFQQAPQDASDVMASGLPITLLPMNCSHQLTVTAGREAAIKTVFKSKPRTASALVSMMTAPRALDKRKFGIDPVMHDVHCALYLLAPEAYRTQKGTVTVSTVNDTSVAFEHNPHGRTELIADDQGTTRVATDIKDPDHLFNLFLGSLKTCLGPKHHAKEWPAKTPKIVVVGSCNMDLTTITERLPEAGETILGQGFDLGYGGKGANQAVAARKSGAEVAMVSCVGDDLFGKGTLDNFKQFGINTAGIQTVAGVSTGTAPIFVDPRTGQNRIIVNLGANEKILPPVVDKAMASLSKPDCIIMQCEMPVETIYHTTQYAKEHGIVSILNVAPADPKNPIDPKKLDGLSYLVVNESEAEAITGMKVTDRQSAAAASKKLLDSSTIGKIIVTLGDKGAVLVGRRGIISSDPFPTKAIDTSGAGDAWLGCFATSIAQGRKENDAMARANLFAAMSVEKHGTQKSYPTYEAFAAEAASRIPGMQIS